MLVLAAACGGGRDDRLDDSRRRCEELTPGVTTFREVAERLPSGTVRQSQCRPDWSSLGADDVCPYATQQVCVTSLFWLTADDRACEGPQAGTCEYRCEVRTAGAPSSGSLPAGETAICARRFIE
jgi:hypothetical protein